MKIDLVPNLSLSLLWKLRYIEWLLIAIHLIMAIIVESSQLQFNLFVYGIFLILSWKLPLNSPLKYRQAYIASAMLFIIGANFLGVSLDLMLYSYIAKSFFLLGEKNTIYVTFLSGIGWTASECFSEIQQLQQTDLTDFKPPYGFGTYNLSTVFVFSLGIYIAVSIFTIFLSSVIVAEHKSRKRAEALTEQIEVLAKNLERTRIARDIHDSLGHTLTDLDIQLKVARKLRDRDYNQSWEAIDKASMLSAQCIEDVSNAIQTIRYSDFNLDRALNNLIEAKRNRQTKIHWKIDLPQLSLSTNYQIYCVVKEGLINVQKHARASEVLLKAYSTSDLIILKLEDNGVGFDLNRVKSGFGIQGMMERVGILNGSFQIDSTPGRGTQILVTFPR